MFDEYAERLPRWISYILYIIKIPKYTLIIFFAIKLWLNTLKQHIKIDGKLFIYKILSDALKTLGSSNFDHFHFSDEYAMFQRTETLLCLRHRNKKVAELWQNHILWFQI